MAQAPTHLCGGHPQLASPAPVVLNFASARSVHPDSLADLRTCQHPIVLACGCERFQMVDESIKVLCLAHKAEYMAWKAAGPKPAVGAKPIVV